MMRFAPVALFVFLLGFVPLGERPSWAQSPRHGGIHDVVVDLERDLGARIGVSIRNSADEQAWSHRGEERFALASTFKTFACAALLARVDAGHEQLSRRVSFLSSDLVTYSPVTEKHAGGEGLTLGELCAATLRTSDNTAANLVLDAIGGPAGLTGYMRAIGDRHTRLDRRETALNEATPGDTRDTTIPNAATASLKSLVFGDALSMLSREQLTRWMADNAVAGPLLRSSLPAGWRIADRSGAGGHGARAIIAVLWPEQGTPLIVAIYIAETTASMDQRNRAIATIGAAIVASHGSR